MGILTGSDRRCKHRVVDLRLSNSADTPSTHRREAQPIVCLVQSKLGIAQSLP
jgi:hypothetical protein